VVPVEILDEGNDVQAQSEDDTPDLVRLPGVAEEIDHLLDGTSTVHVQRDSDKIIGNRFADDVSLFLSRVFQKLLAEVVAKGV
jgi:hypothetical protein